MLQSMTAFARVQKQVNSGQLCWEIRSVNHRYLDASFRLPEAFRFMETNLRACFRNKINRGKIECQLKYQSASANNQSMIIDKEMVNALVDMAQSLAGSYHVANDLSVSQILAWPGIVTAGEPDMEALSQQALVLFQDAIEQLKQARMLEGDALQSHVKQRLDALECEVVRGKSQAAAMIEQARDKLLSRVSLLKMEVNEGRLEQEITLMLARLDVNEELDRLATHIEEVRRILDKDAVAGRRLDFLMQELNREANTLSSKSDSSELTKSAVEMKVLIEQMREQIQNIE